MKRTSRGRLRPSRPSGRQFAALERAFRGADPVVSPEWAAEALSKSRNGRRLLIETIESKGPSNLRRAAIYGFVFGNIKPAEFSLLLRVFQDPNEEPSVRGQAAEALGPRVRYPGQAGIVRRRDVLARSAFLRGLEDPEPEVRFWSVFALARPGRKSIIHKLEGMTNDPALVQGMWTVGQEARWAINWILGRDVDRDPASL